MITLGIVQQMYVEGQERWPSIVVALEDFRCHCVRLCEDEDQRAKMRAGAADIYLCCACSLGDPVAVALFQRDFSESVRRAIARVHADPEFVQDTLQEFWKKLLVGPDARVRSYKGPGPFQAWLRVCATRLAIDRRRTTNVVSDRENDLGNCLAEQVFGPESTLTRARFYSPFRLALHNAIAGVTYKERNLLRLHVIEHCSIDQIGQAYHVHRATVARWLETAREHILQSVRSELDLAGPRLTDDEFRSVARLLGSDLAIDTSVLAGVLPLEGDPSARSPEGAHRQ